MPQAAPGPAGRPWARSAPAGDRLLLLARRRSSGASSCASCCGLDALRAPRAGRSAPPPPSRRRCARRRGRCACRPRVCSMKSLPCWMVNSRSCMSRKWRSSFSQTSCELAVGLRGSRRPSPRLCRPSPTIGFGVRMPATTSSPWALIRYSPKNRRSPVAGLRVKATPVAQSSPRLPKTIACTLTAVPRRSGDPLDLAGTRAPAGCSSSRRRRRWRPRAAPAGPAGTACRCARRSAP